MKRNRFALIAVGLVAFLFSGNIVHAAMLTGSDVSHLDPQTQMQVLDVDGVLKTGNVDTAYYLLSSFQGQVPQEYVQLWIDEGYFADYIDEIQGLGYTVTAASSTPLASTESSTPTPTPEPESFTVESYDPPKTMWAVSVVNCREGASTSYNKVDSLEQYEEVTVTGVASTGWFEIDRNGSKAYVSNKYLTDVDPHDRTVYDYDEENHEMNAYEFTDTDPEVIDQVVASLEAEKATTTEVVEETVTEVVPESTEEVVEEESTEPTLVDTFEENVSRAPYMLVGIIVCLAVAAISAVIIFKKPSRKDRD